MIGPSASMLRAALLSVLAVSGCTWLAEPLAREELPDALAADVCNDVADGLIALDAFVRDPAACCSTSPLEDVASCRELVTPPLRASLDAAIAAGLRWSSECAERMIGDEDGQECPDPASGGLLSCALDCQLLHGDQPEGAACEAYGHRMSDCAQGLVCGADRVCHQPCELPFVAPEDGYCGVARGMWFVTCDVGLACNAEGRCQVAQPVGGPCGSDGECAVGSWCDAGSGTCASDLAGQSACERHEQCVWDVCKDGRCFEPESPACGRWGW